MHPTPDESSPEPIPQGTEQSDGKVVRLIPRRIAPDTPHVPPLPDDDNPGPSAA
ncbi:hypothetical protein [Microvirga vignae]|uniref:hypothetical protein n=1 Tax=Microvirga vignae TaxID=1225564 RepID=UPI000AD6CE93|nr:hypothetical protein [Microvirga vignae]